MTAESEQERDLLSVAIHEAGHLVVADHFGLRPTAIATAGAGGVCNHNHGTPHQIAAVAWAGILAQDIHGLRPAFRKEPKVPLPLTRDSLPLYHRRMFWNGGLEQLSDEDHTNLYRDRSLGPLETAFDILVSHERVLAIEARLLVKRYQQQSKAGAFDHEMCQSFLQQEREQSLAEAQAKATETGIKALHNLVPLPVSFPSDWTTFTLRVAGGWPAAEIAAFKAQLANPTTATTDPPTVQQSTTAAADSKPRRLGPYEKAAAFFNHLMKRGGFNPNDRAHRAQWRTFVATQCATKEGWESLGRDYQRWEREGQP